MFSTQINFFVDALQRERLKDREKEERKKEGKREKGRKKEEGDIDKQRDNERGIERHRAIHKSPQPMLSYVTTEGR